MKRCMLIRHGRTEANEKWLYCGSTDLSLSDAGREELLVLHCVLKLVIKVDGSETTLLDSLLNAT